jgi:multiple sugar transport system substrate-binding protein
MERKAGLLILLLLPAIAVGRTTIDLWESYNDEEHEVFMQIVAEYETQHPDVEIDVQRVPFFGMEQKILTAAATRTNPDIARVDVAFVAKLALRGALVDLGEFGAEDLSEELVPAAFESNVVRGTVYGIPDQTNCVVLFYNRALFEKAGLDPDEPPRDWAELIEYARKLTDEEEEVYGFAMRNSLWWTLPFFNTFGAEFLSEDGLTCVLNSAEGVEALQLKIDFYQTHGIEAGAWRPGAVNPDVGFQSSKYAMVFNGPWKVRTLEKAGIDFGVGLIPEGPKGTSTTVGGTNMVVFGNSECKREAYEFLRHLVSTPVQARWANELGQIPVNLNSYPEVDTVKHPYINVFLEQMQTAVPRPQVPDYPEVENLVNPELEIGLSGGKSAKEALDAAAKKVSEFLKEAYEEF